ncbi:MAG: NAD(P)-dependent oxidoreductase [Bryobacterales bacterium]|nr:NAD(P)-dependent oxidoreductase [Bryobacterales bacterium]
MAKLGFCGLGIMGYPMARHLINGGHDVAVWSHTARKAQQLAADHGAKACGSPAEVGRHAECVFLCVGDTSMSEQVILGADGIAAGARKGTAIVDTSTVSPSSSREITETLGKRGIDFLGAPVTGSKPGAEAGTLTFMVGGDQAVYNRVRPYMELMGKQLFYCGGPGMGLNAKLTQNLILSNILQAFNEGMVLATKAGVNPELMLEVLDKSAARSGLISYKAPFVLDRNFFTNFSVKWMHKDIGLMLDSGKELGVPLPMTGLNQQLFQSAIGAGLGEEDICSTIKVLEQNAGVEVKRS